MRPERPGVRMLEALGKSLLLYLAPISDERTRTGSKMDTCPETIAFRPLISAICPPAPVAPSSLVRSTPKFCCKPFQPTSAQENYSLFLNRSPSFCIVVGSILGSWALHMPEVEYLGVLSPSAFFLHISSWRPFVDARVEFHLFSLWSVVLRCCSYFDNFVHNGKI